MDTTESLTASSPNSPEGERPQKRRRRKSGSARQSQPNYEIRYFKDERGRSVQLRRLISLEPTDWEPLPSSKSSYSTFDNSRLTYARSGGLPSLGKKYAAGSR